MNDELEAALKAVREMEESLACELFDFFQVWRDKQTATGKTWPSVWNAEVNALTVVLVGSYLAGLPEKTRPTKHSDKYALTVMLQRHLGALMELYTNLNKKEQTDELA